VPPPPSPAGNLYFALRHANKAGIPGGVYVGVAAVTRRLVALNGGDEYRGDEFGPKAAEAWSALAVSDTRGCRDLEQAVREFLDFAPESAAIRLYR